MIAGRRNVEPRKLGKASDRRSFPPTTVERVARVGFSLAVLTAANS